MEHVKLKCMKTEDAWTVWYSIRARRIQGTPEGSSTFMLRRFNLIVPVGSGFED
jgi:hypothetical protein